MPSKPVPAWKPIRGLSALFGFGPGQSEHVDCGGYPKRPLKPRRGNPKRQALFSGRRFGHLVRERKCGALFLFFFFGCKWFGV